MLPFLRKIGFTPRVSALYGAFFIVAGISQPFLPVWLKAKGLDPGTIGLVLAAPMLLRVLTIPLATRTAHRPDALRLAIIVAARFSAVGYSLTGLATGALAIMLAYDVLQSASRCRWPRPAFKGLTARGKPWRPAVVALYPRQSRRRSPPTSWNRATSSDDHRELRHCLGLVRAGAASRSRSCRRANETQRRRCCDPAFIAVVAAASDPGQHAMFYGFLRCNGAAPACGTVIAALWALGVPPRSCCSRYRRGCRRSRRRCVDRRSARRRGLADRHGGADPQFWCCRG